MNVCRTQKGFKLLLVAGSYVGSLQAGIIAFTDFSDVSQISLNGNAAQVGSVLRLTPAIASQKGTAYFSIRQGIQFGFDTSFSFRVSPGADGFAFLVQNASASALGGIGGGMGYDPIPNSMAVEFDTFLNAANLDPNGNHVAVQSCGTAPNTQNHASCNFGVASSLPFTIDDGNIHTARIVYDPGSLRIFLGPTNVLTSGVNLDSLLSLSGGQAFVGFSAATGGSSSTHDILSWNFTSPDSAVPEPTSGFLAALGFAGLLIRGLCSPEGQLLRVIVRPGIKADSTNCKVH